MLQFPRWKVDVTVSGDVVKSFYETATTAAAAIAKAKHKMRGAVSSAGAFKFKATKAEGESKSPHATKKKAASQFHVWGSGPGGETTYYRGPDRRAAEAAFDERAYRNYEGMGDDDEDVVIKLNGRELRRFGPETHQPTYFGGAPRTSGRHHATKAKKTFDWEVSGPSDLARQGFMRGVKEKIKRIGVEAYDKDSGAYLGSGFFSATSKTDALKQAKTSSWYFKTLAENSYKPLVMKAA